MPAPGHLLYYLLLPPTHSYLLLPTQGEGGSSQRVQLLNSSLFSSPLSGVFVSTMAAKHELAARSPDNHKSAKVDDEDGNDQQDDPRMEAMMDRLVSKAIERNDASWGKRLPSILSSFETKLDAKIEASEKRTLEKFGKLEKDVEDLKATVNARIGQRSSLSASSSSSAPGSGEVPYEMRTHEKGSPKGNEEAGGAGDVRMTRIPTGGDAAMGSSADGKKQHKKTKCRNQCTSVIGTGGPWPWQCDYPCDKRKGHAGECLCKACRNK